MFRKKKAKEKLQTGGGVPASANLAGYESHREGKYLEVRFIHGDSLKLATEDDAQINFCDEVNVFKDSDGTTHKIVTSQIQNVQEKRAVRCGKCGELMLPFSMDYYAKYYGAQWAVRCSKCFAYIRVMDADA